MIDIYSKTEELKEIINNSEDYLSDLKVDDTPHEITKLIISKEDRNPTMENKNKKLKVKFIYNTPYNWITPACRVGNNTGIVALCCYFQHGLRSKKIDKSFHISTELGKEFGFNNRQQNSALKLLANAGLIKITPREGKHYLIEVIESDDLYYD